MNDSQLRAVIAAAQTGSFSKAAEQMYISATALKKQIDALEKEINTPLFLRSNRGIELTSDGEHFLSFSISCINLWDKELSDLEKRKNSRKETIRICYETPKVDDPLYYHALTLFKKQYPDYNVELIAGDSFNTNKFDLYLGSFPKEQTTYQQFVLAQVPLYAIMQRKHPLAKETRLTIDMLSAFPLLAPHQSSLSLISPNIETALSNCSNLLYLSASEIYSRAFFRCFTENRICICIGLCKLPVDDLVQIPLSPFLYAYSLYSKKSIQKKSVTQYIEFLQTYYKDHISAFYVHETE